MAQGRTLDPTALRQSINNVLSQLNSAPSVQADFGVDTDTTRVITVGDAYDPNDLRGPLSLKGGHWVSGRLAFQYTVAFDNLAAKASAPAHEVKVLHYLDPNLDLTTLSLAQINLPQITIQPTANISPVVNVRPFYQQQSLPAQNLDVDIKSGINLDNGQLSWDFQSIDPNTGLPPTNADQGFLPPGQEGSMTITISPKPNLPTGTVISSYATITFDANPPLSTSTWVNTIDNTPPTSQVQTLPAQSGLLFPVQWSGTDVGSGVQDYTLYVSDNGAPFTAWLVHTTATQAGYFGAIGHTYRFYSIARDNVDNAEAPRTSWSRRVSSSQG